jgi:beta-glucosidase
MQSRTVEIDLDERAFAYYDPAARRWIAEPGAYDLLIGGSAADIELQATLRLEARL